MGVALVKWGEPTLDQRRSSSGLAGSFHVAIKTQFDSDVLREA